jgi:hypothetical protein
MNIWEVVCLSDLIKILKESSQQFVILGIVLESTPKSLQTYIKKFLKEKAPKFPNMKFLYFKATQKDLGKISLLDKDEKLYPYIFHVYDTSNIFIKVNSANPQTIVEAFNAGEQYYLKNLEEFINLKKEVLNNNSQNASNNTSSVKKNDSPNLNQEVNINTDDWAKQQSEMDTQQKLIEKIVTLQQRAKDFNIELLKDIQQRKEEEEKIRRK